MKRKQGIFYSVIIIAALVIVCFVIWFYVGQMNKTISENTIQSISEMAEHDKTAIQTYIEIYWQDLYEIKERFISDQCRTIEDLEERMALECDSANFTHICLVAEDGTVFTDDHFTYSPKDENDGPDFLAYFGDGKEKIVRRADHTQQDGWLTRDSIIYGVKLHDLEVDGVRMEAIIGTSSISAIQDNMVIDSFLKDGKSRGHSAIIDRNGNYIVNINKEIYLNQQENLYVHLSESTDSELSNEELAGKLEGRETFGFYHFHEEEDYRELFYFIPFEGMDLYFIMSLNEEVFVEQSRAFATISITMLAISMVTVVCLLLAIMVYQNKTIRIVEKARAQRIFLSNMSHEIRTPLNGLIGMNHLIAVHIDKEEQRPQIKEWLRKSNSTANYLLSLVNDVLDMSKLQEGKVDLMKEPFSVDAMIEEIYAMQVDNIRGRGVTLHLEKDISEPYLEGDVVRVKQILMNIVGNAAKFTPKGGEIRLSVSQHKINNRRVETVYRCKDTGIGMSKEYLGKIFDSFSQERNRNTCEIKGTGLGMAISKLLTDAMGGRITVESELGKGSVFTVTIPSVIVSDVPEYLLENGSETVGGNGINDWSAKQNKKAKILVAEDVELNAEVLLEILALEGFETVHVRNGREAVETFQASEEGEFDIVLMDMKMPVMDGCEAAKEIRRMDRADAKTVSIYACTANTFQEDRNQALASGMNDFLTKPIDVSVMIKKMNLAAKEQSDDRKTS